MNWFILALISVLTVSISSVLQKILMRDEKSDPLVYSFFFQFFCSILIFIFALFKGFVFPPINAMPLNYIVEAVLYAGFAVFLFKALKLIEASEVTILTTTGSLWTIAASLLFLGESFDIPKLAGVLLILSAVVIVSKKSGRGVLPKMGKGQLYALLAAFCIGTAFANDAFILRSQVDAVSYTAVAFLLPSIVILLVRPQIIGDSLKFLRPQIVTRMGLLGIFYSTSAVTAYLAYQSGGNASQIAPITQVRVVITVILSALLLKERTNLGNKIISAILISIGVLLLR